MGALPSLLFFSLEQQQVGVCMHSCFSWRPARVAVPSFIRNNACHNRNIGVIEDQLMCNINLQLLLHQKVATGYVQKRIQEHVISEVKRLYSKLILSSNHTHSQPTSTLNQMQTDTTGRFMIWSSQGCQLPAPQAPHWKDEWSKSIFTIPKDILY